MSHNFGELLKQYLGRQNLTQGALAEGTAIPEVTISRMCHGQQLTGAQARPRILKIIAWLVKNKAIDTREEANDLLDTAVFAPLSPHRNQHTDEENHLEACLYHQLPSAEQIPLLPLLAELPPAPPPQPAIIATSWGSILRTSLRHPRRTLAVMGRISLLTMLIYGGLWLYWYGGWYVLVSEKDDINIVLHQGQIVATNYDTNIDGYARLQIEDPTAAQHLTFININGGGPAECRFELRYWWESKWVEPNCLGAQSYSLGLNEEIKFWANNERLPTYIPRQLQPSTADQEILVRIPRPADFALVLINGQVVGGAYGRSDQFPPINIAPYLLPDQDNDIEFLLWARWETVRWEFYIEQDGQPLWQCEGSKMVDQEEVIRTSATIYGAQIATLSLPQCPVG